MLNTTIGAVRKYGAKVGTAVTALVVSGAVMAQEAGPGADILAKVNASMSAGEKIAASVVLGLFTLWAIKLLWRSK